MVIYAIDSRVLKISGKNIGGKHIHRFRIAGYLGRTVL